MSRIEHTLTIQVTQTNHLVLNMNPMTGMRLQILSRIPASRARTQVDDTGKNRHAMPLDGATDIACHAARHRQIIAVRRLKFVVDQCLRAVDTDANETVRVTCRDRGLLGVDNFKNLDVVSPEGETREVAGLV